MAEARLCVAQLAAEPRSQGRTCCLKMQSDSCRALDFLWRVGGEPLVWVEQGPSADRSGGLGAREPWVGLFRLHQYSSVGVRLVTPPEGR